MPHKSELLGEIETQVKTNLVSQFALSRYFDHFTDGGGVDTVHNVRRGVFSSEEAKSEITNRNGVYDKKAQQELHGGSKKYIKINKELQAKKKNGELTDANTGKTIKRNAKVDLDHVISTKEIHNDPGRKLAKVSSDELANNESNLALTDRSINRSMGAKNKQEYAQNLEENKIKWQKEAEKVKKDPNLSEEKKRAKLENIKNRTAADKESIEQNYMAAHKAYENKINKTYYTSKKFLGDSAKVGVSSGISQGEKQALGALMYELADALFSSLKPVISAWRTYSGFHARISDFLERFRAQLKVIKQNLGQIKDAFFQGFSGGFISSIVGIVIDTFKTLKGKVLKIMNDLFVSLIQAGKILASKNESFPARLKAASKLILTALVVSVGAICSESLTDFIKLKIPSLPRWIIDTGVSTVIAILTGVLSAFIIYAFDDLKGIIAGVKKKFKQFMSGLVVTGKSIEASYNQSIAHIDDLYKKLLSDIYQQYQRTHQLQKLAYDLDLPTADQFVASAELAQTVGVSENRILKNKSDITKYFS